MIASRLNGSRMKFLMVVAYVFLGFALSGYVWLWVASLIGHACNMWWETRAKYRSKMDDRVSELFDEQAH